MASSSQLDRAAALRERARSDPGAVDPTAVLALLQEPDREVQAAATRALLAVLSAFPGVGVGAVDRLVELLEGPDVPFEEELLLCLARVASVRPTETQAAREAALARLSRAELRGAASVFLAQLASHDPAPLVGHVDDFAALLRGDDSAAGRNAAHVLSQLARAHPVAVADAVSALADGAAAADDQTALKSLTALGAVADARPGRVVDILKTVVGRFEAGHDGVRANALGVAAAAASTEPAAVAPHLTAVVDRFDDPAARVRGNAAAVALRVGQTDPDGVDSSVTGGLTELVDDPDPTVRANACRALGHVGGPLAVELLRDRARSDPEPAVRQSATRAVERLSDRGD